MENNNSASNTNTVLIVIVLLILVGFGVWWFTMRNSVSTPANTSGVNVKLNFPGGGEDTAPPEPGAVQ